MSIFDYFRPSGGRRSAAVARERLQIIMAHERAAHSSPDFIEKLQAELLDVIAKYVQIDREHLKVKLDHGGDCSVLEVNVELPPAPARRAAR